MTAKLAAALLAAQKAMPAIHKDSKAEVPTKAGGKFSYTYLSLQRLLEIVLPVLNGNGLALTQVPALNDGRPVLRTVLLHESGESLEADSPLVVTGSETPQAWGGAVTYARRYALTALLGIAADEDDDGAAASKPQKILQKKNKPVVKTDDTEDKPTNGKLEEIDALVNELASMRDVPRAQVLRALEESMGKPPSHYGDTEAVMAIARLRAWRDKAMAAA